MSVKGSASPRRPRGRALRLAAALVGIAGCAVGPKAKTEVRTLKGIELTHTNVVEQIGEESPDIVVTASGGAVAGALAEQGLRLYFRERGTEDFTKVSRGTAGTPSRFLASIPHQAPGTWVDYYIEVRGTGGELLTFPGTAGAGVYSRLRFKGRAPTIVVRLHGAMMFLALLFFLFAAYRSWRFVKGARSYRAIERSTLYGLVALFVGGFPLGFVTAYYTFGSPWAGFPLGGDVTDTKTLIVFVYWLIVVGLFRPSRSGAVQAEGTAAVDARRRRYARLVIAGTIVTGLVYAVPHGV